MRRENNDRIVLFWVNCPLNRSKRGVKLNTYVHYQSSAVLCAHCYSDRTLANMSHTREICS